MQLSAAQTGGSGQNNKVRGFVWRETGDTSVDAADTTTTPTQNTSDGKRKEQQRDPTNSIKHVQQASASALGREHMGAGCWAGWANVLLRRHNYSYKISMTSRGQRAKHVYKDIEYERVKEVRFI